MNWSQLYDIISNMKYSKGSHSVYKLTYHLVLVVKYRRKVITEGVFIRLKDILITIAHEYEVKIIDANYDSDHIHILFESKPTLDISRFIMSYKSCSSRLIKKEYPYIRKKLWKSAFWSPSYCLLTTGGAPIETIKRYIQNQRLN